MNKVDLGTRILRLLEAYDRSRFEMPDIRDVYAQMDAVTNEIAYRECMKFGKELEGFHCTYGNPLTVSGDPSIPIFFDQTIDAAYAKLPAKVITIHDGTGIKLVWDYNNSDTIFIPVRTQFKYLFKGHPAITLADQYGYFLDTDSYSRIVFTKNPLKFSITHIKIRMMGADSTALDDIAQYPLPPNYENEMVTRVVEYLTHNKVNETFESSKP